MTKPGIICVDDEGMILQGLKEQLKRIVGEKCQIETAESGEEALEIAAELTIEGIDIPIILSDYIMPGMKGDELIIQFHEKYPSTLKILLTGQVTPKAVGKIINNAQLYRYLAKPWAEADLALTINEGLRSFYEDKKQE